MGTVSKWNSKKKTKLEANQTLSWKQITHFAVPIQEGKANIIRFINSKKGVFLGTCAGWYFIRRSLSLSLSLSPALLNLTY
mmetsp:Transcript_5015/g.9680  ORF Transcript_5015/g.9680 Transcript_5015/m.9680 type:complete len:81 (+) Transcript_5015:215-457(+)